MFATIATFIAVLTAPAPLQAPVEIGTYGRCASNDRAVQCINLTTGKVDVVEGNPTELDSANAHVALGVEYPGR